jgi:hypothetical protein
MSVQFPLMANNDAVKDALVYDWSNGQVEGQVNRLKTIKHQMYGRANFDLLRQRVLGLPYCFHIKCGRSDFRDAYTDDVFWDDMLIFQTKLKNAISPTKQIFFC